MFWPPAKLLPHLLLWRAEVISLYNLKKKTHTITVRKQKKERAYRKKVNMQRKLCKPFSGNTVAFKIPFKQCDISTSVSSVRKWCRTLVWTMEENLQFCFAPLIMVQQLPVSLLKLKYVSFTKNSQTATVQTWLDLNQIFSKMCNYCFIFFTWQH